MHACSVGSAVSDSFATHVDCTQIILCLMDFQVEYWEWVSHALLLADRLELESS